MGVRGTVPVTTGLVRGTVPVTTVREKEQIEDWCVQMAIKSGMAAIAGIPQLKKHVKRDVD